jgi:hypothetical protein
MTVAVAIKHDNGRMGRSSGITYEKATLRQRPHRFSGFKKEIPIY